MPNLFKGFLATIVILTFPIALAGNSSPTSSFQEEIEPKEVSNLILIQGNSLKGSSGVLAGIEAQVWEMARKYEIDYDRFLGLAICESTLNPDAKGEAGEIGLYQFLPSTFSDYAEKYERSDFSVHNTNHQIELAAQMISNGKESEWTCLY